MGDPKSLVFAGATHGALIRAAVPGAIVAVNSRAELTAATQAHRPGIAFVDEHRLAQLDDAPSDVAVVGVIDDASNDALRPLATFPWLSHVITTAMLASPLARAYLTRLHERLEHGPEQAGLGPTALGRVALLARSDHREARFERMREFFEGQRVAAKTIASSYDVAEELVTNALYDAPVEGGYYDAAVPRTEHVALPPEHACEISYGLEHGSAFVRVRDPFGALTRSRLIAVLARCNTTGVALDESRGGAGLGLWRVFTTASSIAITVIPGSLTDILVRFEPPKKRGAGKRLRAVHLVLPAERAVDGAQGRFAADHDHDLLDESFTAVCVA